MHYEEEIEKEKDEDCCKIINLEENSQSILNRKINKILIKCRLFVDLLKTNLLQDDIYVF